MADELTILVQLRNAQMLSAVQELQKCNSMTARFGLVLSEGQIQTLVTSRFEALRDAGRVEFGQGIMEKLIYAFCDSPYITQENYEDTLIELQNSFYYYKNESEDQITDNELIDYMKRLFDGKARGSLEYLLGTSLEELCRNARFGNGSDDTEYIDSSFEVYYGE